MLSIHHPRANLETELLEEEVTRLGFALRGVTVQCLPPIIQSYPVASLWAEERKSYTSVCRRGPPEIRGDTTYGPDEQLYWLYPPALPASDQEITFISLLLSLS